MGQVLVLNASFEPLNVCTVRRAHVLVFKGKAEVIEQLEQPLRAAAASFPWPHVIRLLNYVRVPRAIQRKISRRALFARDGWRCVYCGTSGGRLTLDHVVPRSRGGESVWENVVTACAPCNLRKGDRSLEESGFTLTRLPKAPAPELFIRLSTPTVPVRWLCSRCGEEHEGLPLDWAFDKPAFWEGPRADGDELTEDTCVWTDDADE